MATIIDRVDVDRQVRVYADGDGQPGRLRRFEMVSEAGRPVAGRKVGTARSAEHVGSIASTIGNQHDLVGLGDRRQAGRQRQVAVGDDDVCEALTADCVDAVVDCPVEAEAGAPEHLSPSFGCPRGDLIVVAGDERREWANSVKDAICHPASEALPVGRRDVVGQSSLGRMKRLDGDQHRRVHVTHTTRLKTPARQRCAYQLGPSSAYDPDMSRSSEIRVAVIGAGSWGTTVAALASVNTPTLLWARRPQLADQINAARVNPDYLPNFALPDQLRATDSLEEAVSDADVVIMAVPSHGFREVAHDASQYLRPWVPIVSLTKGIERETLMRMTEVAAEEMPGRPVGVMTGPNLAKEIMAGQPAASVVAIPDSTIAAELQRILTRPSLRVYTNPDVVGCEIAGVVKNVIAIASGMAEGMGFGDNTRATLITRGLAEMTRLGVAMGADPSTFAGLAGMGDLIATCSSKQSRNNSVGIALGQGQSIGDILAAMHMVAEGVKSSPSVLDLARRYGVEMPITEQVVAVCHEGRGAGEALAALMSRTSRSELG